MLLAVVLVATTLAVVMLMWTGLVLQSGFGTTSDKTEAEGSRLLTAAFVVGTTVPTVCAIITYKRELLGQFGLNVALLLLTLVVGVVATINPGRDTPAPERAPVTGCREYSGGDTSCPGG